MNRVLLKDLPAEETKVTTLDLLKTMDPNDVQNEKSGQLTLELTHKPFKEEDMEKEGTEGTDVIEKALSLQLVVGCFMLLFMKLKILRGSTIQTRMQK
ncbi:hypothetical protein SEVIR_6G230125v4 [Setaria viridis]